MTCFEQAPDILDYKEWCLNSWQLWCNKHDVELFILSDELRDKTIMKPTWQRWHVFEILEEVGKQFEVTRERIRQIEAKALRKMRHPTRIRKLEGFIEMSYM